MPLGKVALVTAAARASHLAGFTLIGASASHQLQKQARRVWGRWMLVSVAVWAYADRKVVNFWDDTATKPGRR